MGQYNICCDGKRIRPGQYKNFGVTPLDGMPCFTICQFSEPKTAVSDSPILIHLRVMTSIRVSILWLGQRATPPNWASFITTIDI